MDKQKVKANLVLMYKDWMDDFWYMTPLADSMAEALDAASRAIDAYPDGLTVRINTHGNSMPVQHGEWIDLQTANDVDMKKGEYMVISLGVSMELPEGYYAKVVPRSSTCMRWGVIMANSVGIIEHEYCGDNDIWGFPAVAIRDTHIPAGTRVCQFCVCRREQEVVFKQAESLGNQDRGRWGSTGE